VLSGPSKEPQYEFEDEYDDDDDDGIGEGEIFIRKDKHKTKAKSAHNLHIRPRQLFKDQHGKEIVCFKT